MNNWDDLRFLLATVRQASFARAGRLLGVDATTVGRRVSALEKAVQARLVERMPDGVRATPAGSRLVALAEEMEARLAVLERTLADASGHITGRVRVTAGDGFAPLLVAAAGRLRRIHPGLDLELMFDARSLDLVRGEADLALRTLRPSDLSLAARKLGALSYGCYASEAYIASHGEPRSLAELSRHALVGLDTSLEKSPDMRWLKSHGFERFGVRTNSAVALLDAVAAGLGVALLVRVLASQRMGLRRLLPREPLPSLPVWLVYRSDERRAPRVRAVADALMLELQAHEKLLQSDGT
jgi:DNA-binding transcriptional LysR family regulator